MYVKNFLSLFKEKAEGGGGCPTMSSQDLGEDLASILVLVLALLRLQSHLQNTKRNKETIG